MFPAWNRDVSLRSLSVLCFTANGLPGFVRDTLGSHSVFLQQTVGGSGLGVGVFDAEKLHNARGFFSDNLCHPDAQAAVDEMLFGDHDCAQSRVRRGL